MDTLKEYLDGLLAVPKNVEVEFKLAHIILYYIWKQQEIIA